jgi:hypothetical protein
MALPDPLQRLWYERLSRTRRRDLRTLYQRTDWKFLAMLLALGASIAAALVYLPY